MANNFEWMTQGPAKVADVTAIAKDKVGYTNKNLHARIKDEESRTDHTTMSNEEVGPRSYELGITNVNKYRVVTHDLHDEDSTTTEIP